MDALDFTIGFIQHHNLRAILLQSRLKRPPVGEFPVTTDPDEMVRHVAANGGNIGILGGEVMVLDFDDLVAMNEMFMKLGYIEPTVRTGSDKCHVYMMPEDVPPRMMWNGTRVGEIQRGPNQYVVAPPSIHPNGRPYKWCIGDHESPILFLPKSWSEFLNGEMTPEVPDFLKKYVDWEKKLAIGCPPEELWLGPPADVVLARAQAMPRSKRRRDGVKFQCPKCREDGHDKSHDNAKVFADGRYACAYAPGDPEHRRAIAKALGIHLEFSDAARATVQISDDDLADLKKPINLDL